MLEHSATKVARNSPSSPPLSLPHFALPPNPFPWASVTSTNTSVHDESTSSRQQAILRSPRNHPRHEIGIYIPYVRLLHPSTSIDHSTVILAKQHTSVLSSWVAARLPSTPCLHSHLCYLFHFPLLASYLSPITHFNLNRFSFVSLFLFPYLSNLDDRHATNAIFSISRQVDRPEALCTATIHRYR